MISLPVMDSTSRHQYQSAPLDRQTGGNNPKEYLYPNNTLVIKVFIKNSIHKIPRGTITKNVSIGAMFM